MQGHGRVRDGFVNHYFTVRRALPSAGGAAPAVSVYGVVNPRVYAPLPEEAATTYR